MKTFKTSIASTGAFVSVLAMALLVVPEDSRAFGFDDEPPMEEIVVIGQRPPARDAQLNRMIAELFEQAYMDELQRQLNQVHDQLHQIDDQIRDAEDSVEQSCRNVRGMVDGGTAECTDVAQALNYICLSAATVLGITAGTGPGGVAGITCLAGYEHAVEQCEANPGGGIPDSLRNQIETYCPDAG